VEATGAVASYVHNAAAPDRGKIGVLVAIDSTAADKAALATLGKQIAMHIAAANPLALTADDIDPALLERERAIAAEKAAASGKPAARAARRLPDSTASMAAGASSPATLGADWCKANTASPRASSRAGVSPSRAATASRKSPAGIGAMRSTHSTASPAPPSCKRPSGARVMATTSR
jgi:hypothetical protein